MYESDADDMIPGLSPDDHQLVPAAGKMPPAKVVMAAVKAGLSFVPAVGGAAIEIVNALEQAGAVRKQAAIELAIHSTQLDINDLRARLDSDHGLAAIWLRGAEAAKTAYSTQKLRALAGVLARCVGAENDERLAYGAILRVLEPLEAEHVQVLHAIEIRKSEAETSPTGDEMLAKFLPHLSIALPYILATLLATGLIRDLLKGTWAGVEGGKAYGLTPLGAEVLAILHEYTEDVE